MNRSMKKDQKILEYITLTIATVILDVGVYFFKFPNNFSFGGVSGMAVVFSHFIPMTSAQINLVINLILLVIGFVILGRDFGVKTAYVTVVSSLLLNVFEKAFPMDRALTGNIMLELCFAIALPALGSAILFNIGSSSGGTDIIAMILKKYSSFNIGPALMLSDLLITIAGFFIFDIKTGLYSLLGLTIRSFMVDTFIENFNLSKYFNVVCDDPEPICDFIVHELNRSASVFHATGAYSGQDKAIVLTALNRTQAVRLRNFIKMTDPKAFILISNTSEIIGKGFHSI